MATAMAGSFTQQGVNSAVEVLPLTAAVGAEIRGVDLARFLRVNQPLPGQPVPFPQFQPTLQTINNSASSHYNALQLKVEKRSGVGLNLLSSYTWSKCLDDGSFFGSNSSGGLP